MSREIKFRAWDKDENRMIHSGTEQNDYPFSWHIHNTGIEIVEYDGTDWNPLKNIKLMQYTGLKDKNGTEIYEGDIITTDIKRPYLIVEFRDGCFMFNCNDGAEDYYDIMLPILKEPQTIYKYGEVIGNIYENPELLK